MSFDKIYPNRKDWRKPYIKRGKYLGSCRPHGGCPFCYSNRFHSTKKKELSAEYQLYDEFYYGWDDDMWYNYSVYLKYRHNQTMRDMYGYDDWGVYDTYFNDDEWDEVQPYITKTVMY